MDNSLLDSNERCLVIFDSVCAGLADCLSLVQTDIKHMTEHRNKLVQLEQQRLQAKLVSPGQLEQQLDTFSRRRKSDGVAGKRPAAGASEQPLGDGSQSPAAAVADPHHLARLKLLDKQLADSFSKALSMCDLQKSSLLAKPSQRRRRLLRPLSQQSGAARPALFRLLWGGGGAAAKSSKQCDKSEPGADKLAGRESDSDADQDDADFDVKSLASTKTSSSLRKARPDNRLIIDDINKQTRLAMQYAKQLEAHLFKVEDLRNKFEMDLKMGLAAKSSARAELELYLGSFLLNVEEVQGFARVCSGDVFEIVIRYGATQKFKAKISVLKDSRQRCDNRQAVFKAKVEDVLAIKAYEHKTRFPSPVGKRVLLGHKLCETRDFFTARSQLMTISLNQTGSIKLNLVVTWNPLHFAPYTSAAASPGLDISHISLPPTPISSMSTLSSLSSKSAATATSANTSNNSSINNRHSTYGSSSIATTITINFQNNNNTNSNQRQRSPHHKCSRHSLAQSAQGSTSFDDKQTIYQSVDPVYGYYIPEPDYLANGCREPSRRE